MDREKRGISEVKYRSMVKHYRQRVGLRQEDLAEQIDVSRRTIVNAETDNCNLSLATAIRLATYFEKTVDELFVRDSGC